MSQEAGRSEAQDRLDAGGAGGPGVICAARQDVAGAMRAYGAAIATDHHEHAARAWYNQGTLHQQRGEAVLAVTAYRRGIEFQHPELSPKAAVNLGYVLFNQLGQAQEAEEAFQLAIASQNQEQARLAFQNLQAMRQLSSATQRGERVEVVDEGGDISVGHGKGDVTWPRWRRRDR